MLLNASSSWPLLMQITNHRPAAAATLLIAQHMKVVKRNFRPATKSLHGKRCSYVLALSRLGSEHFCGPHSQKTASRLSAAIATIVSCTVLHTVCCVHGKPHWSQGTYLWIHCMNLFLLFLDLYCKYFNTPACYET